MKLTETKLKGAFIIELERQEDQRGFFARTFCQNEFKDQGIVFNVVQTNISSNAQRGTLRGMHYQKEPHQEAKVVTCIRGAIFDVIIDLRPDSKTYQQHFSIELNENTFNALYIPKDFAHGFQTLEDNSVVSYLMSDFYHPEFSAGIRFNDPAFNINWPLENSIISNKDLNYPDFSK